MLLSGLSNFFCLAAIFFFIILPCIFVYNVCTASAKINNEAREKLAEEIELAKPVSNAPKPETFRTVKKEPGSYSVFDSDGVEAIVIRVDVPNEGKLWVAALAVKNGTHSDRVKTKKEAVALAIELLKEHKEKKNGS